MIRKSTCLLVLILFASVFSSGLFAQDTAMGVKIGEKAPDFTLTDLQTGEEVRLYDLVGEKVIMLEFWAPWCDICKREMPELVREYGEFKDKGFELLSIVLHAGDMKDVRDIMEEKKLNYPVLHDKDFSVATKLYRLAGPIPLKVIIDHNGIVRYAHVGDYPPNENEVPFVLEDLLAEMRAQAPGD